MTAAGAAGHSSGTPCWSSRGYDLRLQTCAVLRDGVCRHLDPVVCRGLCGVAEFGVLRLPVQPGRVAGAARGGARPDPGLWQRGSEERFQGQALQFAEDPAALPDRRRRDAAHGHVPVDLAVAVVRPVRRSVPGFGRCQPVGSDRPRRGRRPPSSRRWAGAGMGWTVSGPRAE